MRPLAVLIGFLLGSSAAIAIGLSMVWVVFLILGSEYTQLEAERGPLLRAIGLFIPLTVLAALGFVGQLRRTPWRRWPLLALVGWFGLVAWVYWPEAI